jgi:hypothetical protein
MAQMPRLPMQKEDKVSLNGCDLKVNAGELPWDCARKQRAYFYAR